jgi:hypothetical protein
MPPDDPAWPPGKNAVKRHMGLRIWMMLQWADWMSASARFRCYTIHLDQCTSQLVDNVNDWELSPTEWQYTPRPAHVVTASSFEVYKWNIANMLRLTFDKLITYADKFSYSTGGLHCCRARKRDLALMTLLMDSFGTGCRIQEDFRGLAVSIIKPQSTKGSLQKANDYIAHSEAYQRENTVVDGSDPRIRRQRSKFAQ